LQTMVQSLGKGRSAHNILIRARRERVLEKEVALSSSRTFEKVTRGGGRGYTRAFLA